jgi:hypothetical protein
LSCGEDYLGFLIDTKNTHSMLIHVTILVSEKKFLTEISKTFSKLLSIRNSRWVPMQDKVLTLRPYSQNENFFSETRIVT